MVYDAKSNLTVLFGGSDKNDTWTWDGQDWTKVNTPVAPLGRSYHAMAFDKDRGVVVLFGGEGTVNGKLTKLNDVWEYDGTWKPIFVGSPIPDHRSGHVMAYHEARKVTIVCGGEGASGYLTDTWVWDGAKWLAISIPEQNRPQRVFKDGVAYDSKRGKIVLHTAYKNRTWELPSSLPQHAAFAGPGHANGGIALNTTSIPRVGGNAIFTIEHSDRLAFVGGFNIFEAGPALVKPLYLQGPAVSSTGQIWIIPQFVLLKTGNPVEFIIPIPNQPILVGQSVGVQAASLEQTNSFRLTDGLVITIKQ